VAVQSSVQSRSRQRRALTSGPPRWYSWKLFNHNGMGEFTQSHRGKIHHFPSSSAAARSAGVRDRRVLANPQTPCRGGVRPGCINKAKEICNYESGLEIHGCAVPDTCTLLSPRPARPLCGSIRRECMLAPPPCSRTGFHEGVRAGKVEGSTADEYANPQRFLSLSRLPTKHCTIPTCEFALASSFPGAGSGEIAARH